MGSVSILCLAQDPTEQMVFHVRTKRGEIAIDATKVPHRQSSLGALNAARVVKLTKSESCLHDVAQQLHRRLDLRSLRGIQFEFLQWYRKERPRCSLNARSI